MRHKASLQDFQLRRQWLGCQNVQTERTLTSPNSCARQAQQSRTKPQKCMRKQQSSTTSVHNPLHRHQVHKLVFRT